MTAATEITAALTPLAPTGSFAAGGTAVPRFVYQLVSGSDNGHLSGAGPTRVRYQIYAYALNPKQASTLAEQAKVALRSALTVSAIYDNDETFDEATKLHGFGFDAAIWPKP